MLALGCAAGLSLAGCLGRTDWTSEFEGAGTPDALPATRTQLESLRGAAIDSGDAEALATYMAYLWQFDREHRAWLDLVEVGKSPKLPDSLSGFDRKTYTDEALAAWTALRPAELPRSAERVAALRADFYAAALAGGCRASQRALGPVMIYIAEEPEPASFSRESAVLDSECGHVEGSFDAVCRAGADLLRDHPEPEYTDLDGDMWPDPSVRVNFYKKCRGVFTEDEKALVTAYYDMAEPWFAEHYPEEHAAWREEQRRLAVARAKAQEEFDRRMDEQRAAEAAAASSQSSGGSTAPAGAGQVNVSLFNECNATVTLFFGDNPGFGSGTTRSVSYNSHNSFGMREGDMIWIMVDGQPGASYSASAGNSRIKITSSCGGFAPQ